MRYSDCVSWKVMWDNNNNYNNDKCDTVTVFVSVRQRKWAVLSLGQQVNVRPHVFDPKQDYLCAMVIEVDFLMKKKLVTVVRLNLLCFVIVLLLYMVDLWFLVCFTAPQTNEATVPANSHIIIISTAVMLTNLCCALYCYQTAMSTRKPFILVNCWAVCRPTCVSQW